MALMLAKTYAAFKAAGVDEDQAQAAAEELAAFEARFASIESAISHVDEKITAIEGKIAGIEEKASSIEATISRIERKTANFDGKFSVLLWAVGVNAAATIAILGALLHHG